MVTPQEQQMQAAGMTGGHENVQYWGSASRADENGPSSKFCRLCAAGTWLCAGVVLRGHVITFVRKMYYVDSSC